MSGASDIIRAIAKIVALETRTEDVAAALVRSQAKVEALTERVARLEVQLEGVRQNVRAEVLADIRAAVAVVNYRLDQDRSEQQALASHDKDGAGSSHGTRGEAA